jgi:hypothetical protein
MILFPLPIIFVRGQASKSLEGTDVVILIFPLLQLLVVPLEVKVRILEREYGFLHRIIKEVVERHLDCGNPCGAGPLSSGQAAGLKLTFFTNGHSPSAIWSST